MHTVPLRSRYFLELIMNVGLVGSHLQWHFFLSSHNIIPFHISKPFTGLDGLEAIDSVSHFSLN